MKGKKWKLAKDALKVGYILIILIYLGMIIEILATKKVSELWLTMFQTDLVFIGSILAQFGVINHLDKKLFLGGTNGKKNNIGANSVVDSANVGGVSDSVSGN